MSIKLFKLQTINNLISAYININTSKHLVCKYTLSTLEQGNGMQANYYIYKRSHHIYFRIKLCVIS